MKKILFAMLLLAFAAYGQKRIAIINTVDDGEPPVEHLELNHLTDRLREIALKILPEKSYAVMTQQSIVAFLGSQEDMVIKCKESEGCLAKLGREINADYICQGRIGRFGEYLTIKVELYDVQSGNLIGSFTDESSEDIYGLLSAINNKAPDMFKKLPGVSDAKFAPSPFASGISGLKTADGYEIDENRYFLASINTEPQGAALSFDGIPDDKCSKTPCKSERPEGDVRIIARLDQYETADTTVLIRQNNQNIAITLKPKFGVLEINPAYSDGIGNDRQWNLEINDSFYFFGEIRLSPGSYAVKLNHECYENIGFEVGIQKGSREVFDMASHAKLKKGGLVLRAEQGGEPVSEPVFINGKRVGETPFSGSVPLCASIEIGKNREKVEVDLKHNDKVEHIVYETIEQRMERERQQRERQKQQQRKRLEQQEAARKKAEALQQQELQEQRRRERKEEEENDTNWSFLGGIYVPYMLDLIDPLFSKAGIGFFGSVEFFKPKYDFFRLGLNVNGGWHGFDEGAVKRIHPDVDDLDDAGFFNIGAFAKFYPASFIYLSGGADFGYYGSYSVKTKNGDKVEGQSTATVVFPVGGGLIFGRPSENFGLVLEALYNIALLKNGYGGYWSFSIGGRIEYR